MEIKSYVPYMSMGLLVFTFCLHLQQHTKADQLSCLCILVNVKQIVKTGIKLRGAGVCCIIILKVNFPEAIIRMCISTVDQQRNEHKT